MKGKYFSATASPPAGRSRSSFQYSERAMHLTAADHNVQPVVGVEPTTRV